MVFLSPSAAEHDQRVRQIITDHTPASHAPATDAAALADHAALNFAEVLTLLEAYEAAHAAWRTLPQRTFPDPNPEPIDTTHPLYRADAEAARAVVKRFGQLSPCTTLAGDDLISLLDIHDLAERVNSAALGFQDCMVLGHDPTRAERKLAAIGERELRRVRAALCAYQPKTLAELSRLAKTLSAPTFGDPEDMVQLVADKIGVLSATKEAVNKSDLIALVAKYPPSACAKGPSPEEQARVDEAVAAVDHSLPIAELWRQSVALEAAYDASDSQDDYDPAFCLAGAMKDALLDGEIVTADDAVAMVEAVAQAIDRGGRSDEAEQPALRKVIDWIKGGAPTPGGSKAFDAARAAYQLAEQLAERDGGEEAGDAAVNTYAAFARTPAPDLAGVIEKLAAEILMDRGVVGETIDDAIREMIAPTSDIELATIARVYLDLVRIAGDPVPPPAADADIIELGRLYDEAWATNKAAQAAAAEQRDLTMAQWPDKPETLRIAKPHWGSSPRRDGEFYDEKDVLRFRATLRDNSSEWQNANPSYVNRALQVIAAWDAHMEARAEVNAASGYDAADLCADQAYQAVIDLEQKIIEARATTLAGMAVKAMVIRRNMVEPESYYDDATNTLVDDILNDDIAVARRWLADFKALGGHSFWSAENGTAGFQVPAPPVPELMGMLNACDGALRTTVVGMVERGWG